MAAKRRKTKKARKQKKEQKPKLAEVEFGENQADITKTIRAEGVKPFSITFRPPLGIADVSFGVDGVRSDVDNCGAGVAMAKYIHRHLVGWTLAKELSLEAVMTLRKASVLYAMFHAIRGVGAQLKN